MLKRPQQDCSSLLSLYPTNGILHSMFEVIYQVPSTYHANLLLGKTDR
jgi:hypothetical protein